MGQIPRQAEISCRALSSIEATFSTQYLTLQKVPKISCIQDKSVKRVQNKLEPSPGHEGFGDSNEPTKGARRGNPPLHAPP